MHDFAIRDREEIEDFTSVVGDTGQVDQGEFSHDAGREGQVIDTNHVNQLLELADTLLENFIVPIDNERDPAEPFDFAVSRIKAGEIEPATTKQTDQSIEGSGFVLNQGLDCVL